MLSHKLLEANGRLYFWGLLGGADMDHVRAAKPGCQPGCAMPLGMAGGRQPRCCNDGIHLCKISPIVGANSLSPVRTKHPTVCLASLFLPLSLRARGIGVFATFGPPTNEFLEMTPRSREHLRRTLPHGVPMCHDFNFIFASPHLSMIPNLSQKARSRADMLSTAAASGSVGLGPSLQTRLI